MSDCPKSYLSSLPQSRPENRPDETWKVSSSARGEVCEPGNTEPIEHTMEVKYKQGKGFPPRRKYTSFDDYALAEPEILEELDALHTSDTSPLQYRALRYNPTPNGFLVAQSWALKHDPRMMCDFEKDSHIIVKVPKLKEPVPTQVAGRLYGEVPATCSARQGTGYSPPPEKIIECRRFTPQQIMAQGRPLPHTSNNRSYTRNGSDLAPVQAH